MSTAHVWWVVVPNVKCSALPLCGKLGRCGAMEVCRGS